MEGGGGGDVSVGAGGGGRAGESGGVGGGGGDGVQSGRWDGWVGARANIQNALTRASATRLTGRDVRGGRPLTGCRVDGRVHGVGDRVADDIRDVHAGGAARECRVAIRRAVRSVPDNSAGRLLESRPPVSPMSVAQHSRFRESRDPSGFSLFIKGVIASVAGKSPGWTQKEERRRPGYNTGRPKSVKLI